jgi:hypothetical protein
MCLLLFVLICCVVSASQAQFVGYCGKRFAIKTTLINGIKSPLVNIQGEVALDAILTVGISLEHSSFNSAENFSTYANSQYNSYNGGITVIPISSNTTLWQFEGFVRLYVPTGLRAPLGPYFTIVKSYGSARVNGTFYGASNQPTSYSYGRLPANIFRMGIGYQQLIHKFILLDFTLSGDYNSFDNTNDYEANIVNGAAHDFGSNLLHYHYSYNLYANSSVGISFFVRAGVLF